MKKILLVVLAVAVLAVLVLGGIIWRSNSHCITRFAKIDLGVSERFSEEERQAAVQCVLGQFKSGYDGCTLKRIYYDEAESVKWAATYIDQPQYNIYGLDPDNIIVLFSDFRTGAFPVPCFNKNQNYDGWTWYLIRDGADGEWREYSHGYC